MAGLLQRAERWLICQRRPDTAFAGKWEFPGGKIEPGEEPEAALRRELLEELGVDAGQLQEVWRTRHQYEGYAPVELTFFYVSDFQGEPHNLAFQQICWVASEQLGEYDFLEADLPLVRMLQRSPAGEWQRVQTEDNPHN